METLAKKTALVYAVVLALTLLGYFIHSIRGIIFDIMVAFFITLAMEKVIQLVKKRITKKRGMAVLLAYLGVIIVISGLVAVVAVPLTSQSISLVRDAPNIVDKVSQSGIFQRVDGYFHVLEKIKTFFAELPNHFSSFSLPALGILGGIASGFTELVIIVVLAVFISLEGSYAWNIFLGFFPTNHRERVSYTAERMAGAVSGFVVGNLIVSLIASGVTLILLLSLHVPYAFPLAVLVGLLDIIPLVGATIAAVVVSLVALTKGVAVMLITLGVLMLYQFIESNFINTIVYSRAVSLSPLLTIIAGLIGAELAGIVGVLLAIPGAAALQVLFMDTYSFVKLSRSGR